MRRSVQCIWMGAGTLGLVLALGCSHNGREKGVTETSQPPLARLFGRPRWGDASVARYRKVQEGPDLPIYEGQNGSPYHIMPSQRQLVQASLPDQEEGNVRVLRIERKPIPEMVERQPEPEYTLIEDASLNQNRDRRTFADVTADPAFAHDFQYRWLIGVVEQNKNSRGWDIRYASVDEEDAYGGRLRLAHGDPPPPLHNGQLVRVEGWIEDRTSPPTYRVQNIWSYSQP